MHVLDFFSPVRGWKGCPHATLVWEMGNECGQCLCAKQQLKLLNPLGVIGIGAGKCGLHLLGDFNALVGSDMGPGRV